jgi:ATP-dependent DNA helicase RecG
VNIASQKVYPPVYFTADTVTVNDNQIIVVTVEEGLSKPYKDADGTIYLKNGYDKRKVTSNDEIARLLGSRNLFADETEIFDSSLKDLDVRLFSEYFKKEFEMTYEEKGLTLGEALIAKKAIRNNHLTLAGLLFFGNEPQSFRPAFTIEEIKYGNPVIRNNQIALFASRTLPYSGLGSGMRRALANQPDLELENDVEGEQFIVRFPRKGLQEA